MRIFFDGVENESAIEFRQYLISCGHVVVGGVPSINSKLRIDAAILYLSPYTEIQNGHYLSHYSKVREELEKTLSPEQICIIADNNGVTSRNYHIIVGQWPRIRAKVDRWINEISIKMESGNISFKGSKMIPFEEAISAIVKSCNRIDNLRVFSFSSKEGATLLNSCKNLNIEKATILLRGFTIVDKFLQLSVEATINESIELWNRMSKTGIIKNLLILRFDFHPTYDMYLFDDRYVILRYFYYDFKSGDYSFDDDVFVFDSSTVFGKNFINKSITSFDNLVDNYSDI